MNKRWWMLVFLCACYDANYLFHYDIVDQERDERVYPLLALKVDQLIDVVFVIDNSGSMAPTQANVSHNAPLFFREFAAKKHVDWKLGVMSTDKSDPPYLGFVRSFDSSLIIPGDVDSFDQTINIFRDSIYQLGSKEGAADEYVFYNLKRLLDLYDGSGAVNPGFLRSEAHLVVIMISDEPEQSEKGFGSDYEVPEFINTMSNYIDSNKVLRFYGVLKARDLKGCKSGSLKYAQSRFERIINQTEGKVMSACVDDFGVRLAELSKDIVSIVGLPSLTLRRRPVPESIVVRYKGKILPPGDVGEGMWFYEEQSNTINFYDIGFIEDIQKDHLDIDFDVEDGIDRG